MTSQSLSDQVALRIALAARALPGITIGEMLDVLRDNLGDQIDETGLSKITVTKLKAGLGQTYDLDGEEAGEDANAADMAAFKQAVRILWGETAEEDLPPLQPYRDGDMPGSVRVAIASNQGEQLDGHFGSCLRYLIYQVSKTEMRLIDIRSALAADLAEDRNAYRVNLIRDCPVLYIVAIGGPAAGKVVQAGIYPLKKEQSGAARDWLQELQQAMKTSPPPWLAKILGVAPEERVKNYHAAEHSSAHPSAPATEEQSSRDLAAVTQK